MIIKCLHFFDFTHFTDHNKIIKLCWDSVLRYDFISCMGREMKRLVFIEEILKEILGQRIRREKNCKQTKKFHKKKLTLIHRAVSI